MPSKTSVRSTVLRSCFALLFVAATLVAANPLKAGIILVGTASGVDNISKVTALINSYNAAFVANLPALGVSFVDKIEDAPANAGTIWTNNTLNNGQFSFFEVTNGTGAVSKNIFDATAVQFANSALAGGANLSNSFSGVDSRVLGFIYTGPQQFQYYVSKNANSFSLWTYMPGAGLHPAYTDKVIGGATLGDISEPSLDYDPLGRGVSHISFYSAVPEPTSLVLVGLAVVGMCGVRRRWA